MESATEKYFCVVFVNLDTLIFRKRFQKANKIHLYLSVPVTDIKWSLLRNFLLPFFPVESDDLRRSTNDHR